MILKTWEETYAPPPTPLFVRGLTAMLSEPLP